MSEPTQRTRTITDSELTLTQYMQPEHSNSLGSVHGGVLLKLCDECGGIIASRHSRRACVTVTVDSVTFHRPALVGQLVLVHGRLTYVGRTSMEVELHVEAEDLLTGEIVHTNSAYFVYVAVDRSLRPISVPGLALQNEDEERRFQEGKTRQELRLTRARGRSTE